MIALAPSAVLPAATDEPLPITVANAGTGSTFGYAIVADGAPEPAGDDDAAWTAPLTLDDGKQAIHIADLAPGLYYVYARVTDEAPFKPVVVAGAFLLE